MRERSRGIKPCRSKEVKGVAKDGKQGRRDSQPFVQMSQSAQKQANLLFRQVI
jgi:hypothetical protein